MAKRIKTLRCPQCDSVHISEKRPDFYECQSCGTDFFLDSDDITIHHKHDNTTPNDYWKKLFIAIAVSFGFLLFATVVIPLILSALKDKTPVAISEEIKKEEEKWDIEEIIPFADAQKKPMALLIGEKYFPSKWAERRENPAFYYAIIDAQTGKEISSKALPEIKKIEFISGIQTFYLENGNIYIIFNQHLLYELNTASYELSKVEPQSFGIEEFSAGLAQIEPYDVYGDTFKVMTNLGKEYYFSPILKKIYTKEEIHKVLAQKPADAWVKTAYEFSTSSSDFPDEIIQLIRYQYWHSEGYPFDAPHFSWGKDYGGSGIFTDKSPYRKCLINDFLIKRSRLIKFEDVTPERIYFSAKVLFSDENQVLIRFKPTLSPSATPQLQLLKTNDFSPLWSIPLSKEMENIKTAIRTQNGGFLLKNNKTTLLLNHEGKEIKTIHFNELE